MKTKLISILLVFIALHSFGQINFEKGYFINNDNQRVECLIKNTDWKNNPDQFEYKLTVNANSDKGTLNTVKEFGVTNFSRYVRADIKIDVSPTEINKLSKERDPVWSQERLFLKVLVEGKAKLYYYEKGKLMRFFYSISDTAINQLIYKQYYVTEDKFAENFKFREQLWIDVRCANASMNSVENLRFNNTELERYFRKYNEGEGNPAVVYNDKKKRDSFHLLVKPGMNFSWTSAFMANNPNLYTDFGVQISYSIGIETEFVLPFNKNKWGIVFDPSYQNFNFSSQNGSQSFDVNYQSIEFPIGLRHYFFLNKELKIFINFYIIPQYTADFNSKVSDLYLYIAPNWSYAFGGGIGYKKLSAEIRYYTPKHLTYWYVFNTDYQRLSLILGYRIW